MPDEFALWQRAVELLADRGAFSPTESAQHILKAVKANGVFLLDRNGNKLRWEQTAEARKEKDDEAAKLAMLRMQRQASQGYRYNPLARSEGGASDRPRRLTTDVAADSLSEFPYSLHLDSLETVLRRNGCIGAGVSLLASVQHEAPDARKKSGAGRKSLTDWTALEDALFAHMMDEGKPTLAEGIEWALRWCAENGVATDAESTVEPYVKNARARYDDWVKRKYPDKAAGN